MLPLAIINVNDENPVPFLCQFKMEFTGYPEIKARVTTSSL